MPHVSVSSTIPYEYWEAIQKHIHDGNYKNMSEFIREAVNKLLSSLERIE